MYSLLRVSLYNQINIEESDKNIIENDKND